MTTTAAASAVTLLDSSSSSSLSIIKAPSADTFSFKAPLLPASAAAGPSKQRRTSLALPESPRVVPTSAWSFRDDTDLEDKKKNGKLRKIAVDGTEGREEWQEKKLRKKWSQGETQMLVDGCNKHGVGNWKTILSDPTLQFDNRSPVDLKDRFRTYFPDAYKQHYPNARTHLSTKIRSTLPDGSSLFEKTRSKKRRPFTEEEDRALKAGYEKHGTIWATIVKDPVFQEQNRRSTDLRDRFRNAFPELYQAAGYKPRSAVKKKPTTATASPASNSTTPVFVSGPSTPATSPRRVPIRAATDDQIAMSTTGPVRVQTRRRRRNTSQGLLFRGGTKSVPQSNAPSEDEDSSGGEEDDDVVKPTRTTRSTSNPLSANVAFGWDQQHKPSPSSFSSFSSSPVTSSTTATDDDDVDNAMDTSLGEYGYEFPANAVPNSHGNGNSGDTGHGNHNGGGSGMTMIGKSAWGTQDWFSPNPRLDNSTATGSSSSAYADGGGGGMSPSSPFSPFSSPPSFSLQTLNSLNSDLLFNPMNNHAFNLVPATSGDSNEHNGHGVFDRYDLVPPTASNSYHSFSHSHSHTNSISSSSSYAPYDLSFSSDFGLGDDYDSRSAFSDEWVITGGGLGGESGGLLSSSMSMDGMGGGAVPGGGGRGFTHHSDYAGDLIFSARTHQPVHQPFALGLGLGFGTAAGASGASGSGPSAGIHPLQLHTHTHTHAHQHSHPHTHPHGHNHSHGHTHTHTPVLSALPLIDEIELTGISLEDTIMADPSSSSASSSLEAARAREGMEHDGIMAMDMNMSASLTTTTSTSTSTSSSTASVSGTSPSEMRQTRTQKDGVGNGNGGEQVQAGVQGGVQEPILLSPLQRRRQTESFDTGTIRRRNPGAQPRSQSAMSEYRLPKPMAFEDLVDLDSQDLELELDDGKDGDRRGGLHGREFGLGLGLEFDRDEEEFPLDVDDDEQHLTPPATPLTRPRRLRGLRSSARRSIAGMEGGGEGMGGGAGGHLSSSSTHGRSVSVPPVDRVGLDSSSPIVPQVQMSLPDVNAGGRHSSMDEHQNAPSSSSSTAQSSPPTQQASSSRTSPSSPVIGLSTPSAAAQIPLPNPPTFASLFLAAQGDSSLYYNLPFLDLHYYGGNGSANLNGGGGGGLLSGGAGGMGHMHGVMPAIWDPSGDATGTGTGVGSGSSRHALDLAQSVRSLPGSGVAAAGAGAGISISHGSSSGSSPLVIGRGGLGSGSSPGGNVHGQNHNVQTSHPPVARSHSLSSHVNLRSHSHSSPSQQQQQPQSHSLQLGGVNLKNHRPSHVGHQRGQSTANVLSLGSGATSSTGVGAGANTSVCPQDLILRSGSDGERNERNKRKRASWDGANL